MHLENWNTEIYAVLFILDMDTTFFQKINIYYLWLWQISSYQPAKGLHNDISCYQMQRKIKVSRGYAMTYAYM